MTQGDLWFCCDVSGHSMHKDPYATFANNGLYYLPLSGAKAGKAVRVASAPTAAELTGPSFAPDGRSMFLSVQHPGETSKSLQALTSRWQFDAKLGIPRCAVVVLRK